MGITLIQTIHDRTGEQMTMPSAMSLSLPFVASSAAVARQQLKEWLVGLGASSETIEDSRLVLSELVGNAVRHAVPLDDGMLEVAWRADAQSGIDIAVTDGGGSTVPAPVRAAPQDESGRGLGIVESLSNRWWLETTRSRSTVHARIQPAR